MATYYVSPSGNDANAGTTGSRWRTFAHAASVAVAGDTVIFGNGTYGNEGHTGSSYVVTLTHSGSSGNLITFRAENNRAAILNSGDGSSAGSAYAYINLANSSYIVIDGFILQNSNSEGFHNNDAAHHITIKNNTIRYIANITATDNFGRDGIYCALATHDLVFDSNIWHDIGRSNTSYTSSLDHALYFHSQNVTITNNIFYGQDTGWDIQMADGANNVLIAYNVFASHNPHQNGQIMVWNNHSGLTIKDNIFFNPPNYAVTHFTESVSSSIFDYNLITNSAGAYSGTGITIGTHNVLNQNALFTNAGAFDFSLQSGSPAIGSGVDVGITTDFLGTTRSGFDLGAYGYAGTGPTAPSIASFVASPASIPLGSSASLSWVQNGATSLTLDDGTGPVPVTGSSHIVSPAATTTYTLTAINSTGSVTATVTVTVSSGVVTVAPPFISSLSAAPTTTTSGGTVNLAWSITGSVTGLSVSDGTTTTPLSVLATSYTVTPSATATYTLSATNTQGSTTRTVTVLVGTDAPPVIGSFSGSPSTSSTPGAPVTLSFSTTGAGGSTGAITINGTPVSGGSLVVNPTTTTDYILAVTNGAGRVSQTITIVVHGAAAENVRSHQIRRQDRQGDSLEIQMGAGTPVLNYPALYDDRDNVQAQQPRGNTTAVQMADQTGGFTENDLLAFDNFGNAKDSQVAISDLITVSGAGGGSGATLTGQNSWYGQVPRGPINGSNTTFLLDYKLANPHALLRLNGVDQLPGIQGDPSNPFATMPTPGGEFTIAGYTLSVVNAPRPGEKFFINYFRKDPMPSGVSSATVTAWAAFVDQSGTGSHAFAYIETGFPSGSGLLGTALSATSTLYSKTQYTASPFLGIPPATLTLSTFSGMTVKVHLDGSLGGTAVNEIWLYDVYLTLTLADSSILILRPTSYTFTSGGDNITAWLPGTNYALGVKIVDGNGNLQLATNTGTSGTISPVWATSGNTPDGSMIWSYQGAQTSPRGQVDNPTLAYDPESAPPSTYAVYRRSSWGSLVTGGSFSVVF